MGITNVGRKLLPNDFEAYVLEWMDNDCNILDQETIAVPKVTVKLVAGLELAQTGLQWVFENLTKGHWAIPEGATQFSLMRSQP